MSAVTVGGVLRGRNHALRARRPCGATPRGASSANKLAVGALAVMLLLIRRRRFLPIRSPSALRLLGAIRKPTSSKPGAPGRHGRRRPRTF